MNVKTKAMVMAGAAATAVPSVVGTMPAGAAASHHEVRAAGKATARKAGPAGDLCVLEMFTGTNPPSIDWGACIVLCASGR
jgi:hypothetical protein